MKIFLAVILALALCADIHAQSNQGNFLDSDFNKLFEKEKTGLEPVNTSAFEKVPMERAVNPATYICGAGDLFTLSLVLPVNLQYTLPVSADGSFMIPRIGTVQVGGRSMQQAEQDVLAAMEKKYPHVKGTLTLNRPRLVYVTISGDVETPGVYTVSSATPVSIALQMANAKTEAATKSPGVFQQSPARERGYFEKLSKQFFGEDARGKKSVRRVFVRHNSGEVETADFVRYSALREEKYNPMLREGDEVVVPPQNSNQPTIGIFGAVRRPGEYEFVAGDDVALLVKIGLGLNMEKKPTAVQLIRGGRNGSDEIIALPMEGIESNKTLLESGDRIIVKGSSQQASGGKIAVKGEVLSPGVYPIIPGKTMLSEVIAMSGGFAADAHPTLAEMYRPQTGSDGNLVDPDREYVRNLRLSILTLEDTLTYRTEARAREGSVSVDFYKLFVKHDSSADVPVFDGDVIIIPKNTMTVQVIGMVANGGYVPWKKGAKLEYYIAKTNGYLEDASKSRVRVLKGNTRAWIDPDEAEIEPGDLIWVHRNQQIRASNSTEVLGMLASVIAALAGIASLAVSVLRK